MNICNKNEILSLFLKISFFRAMDSGQNSRPPKYNNMGIIELIIIFINNHPLTMKPVNRALENINMRMNAYLLSSAAALC